MCVALQRSAKQPPANKPASARLAFIRDLHEQGASTSTLSKLRLVGRSAFIPLLFYFWCLIRSCLFFSVLSVDETSSTVLLEHEGYSVLVDLSLCLANGEQDAFRYLPRLRTVLSVMGHVEPNLDEVRPILR